MVYNNYTDRVLGKLENLNKIYANMMYTKVDTLKDTVGLRTIEHLRTPPTEGLEPLNVGDRWGGEYMNLWIKCSYTIPKELEGKKLYVIPHTDAYEIMFFKNGIPDGIFNSKGDYMGIMHSAQLLTDNAIAGESFNLAFECYANHFCADCHPYVHYGKEVPVAKESDFIKTFRGIDVCVLNEDIHNFVFDLNIVWQMAKYLDQNNFVRHRAQVALEQVFVDIVQYPAHFQHNRLLVHCVTSNRYVSS